MKHFFVHKQLNPSTLNTKSVHRPLRSSWPLNLTPLSLHTSMKVRERGQVQLVTTTGQVELRKGITV